MSILRKAGFATALTLSSIGILSTAVGATPADEAAFLADINALRTSKGIAPLTSNAALQGVARNWAGQMANAGRISHNRSLASQVPSGWTKLGENVGVGGDQPSLHRAFVASPSHHANLVDPSFTETGIAVVDQGGRKWVVETFQARPKPAPRPRAAAASSAPKPASSIQGNARSLRAKAAISG